MNAPEIEARLRERVIGQDVAVRQLAVAAANHLRRLAYHGDVELEKSNVLLLGPTGVGKTHMVRSLAKILELPFASVAATAITQAGFQGLDPEFILRKLVQGFGKKSAQLAIAYIDEVDKLARRSTDESDQAKNLPTGVGVQQALLDILEGKAVELMGQGIFDTTQTLFVLSGAFVGVENLVARRIQAHAPRPTAMSQAEALAEVEPRDLIAYGLIPEFVGRVPVLIKLRPLTTLDIYRILSEPPNGAAKQMTALVAAAGASLRFSDGFLHLVAREAIGKGEGARGLKATLHGLLDSSEALYDPIPGARYYVTPDGAVIHDEAAAPATDAVHEVTAGPSATASGSIGSE